MESGTPMYARLRDLLRSQIDSGEYPAGQPIPSERELARIHGMNRMTVRGAVDQLVTEGSLRRVQGKGTFVVGQEAASVPPKDRGFTRVMRAKAPALSGRVLLTEARPAAPRLALLFGLQREELVFFCQKVFSADGVPVELEETYLPLKYAPGIVKLDLEVYSAEEVLAQNGLKVARATQALRLVQVEDARANLLSQEAGSTAFLLECVGRAADGNALKLTRTYTRGDLCNYATILRRSGAVL